MSLINTEEIEVLEEDGIRKAIYGYTWPGIEFGEPPSCPYTFFEYVDAVRFGDLPAFLQIETVCQAWWHPTLDRGAGALLHFAVDHGQLAMVKFLIEKKKVPVNQRCNNCTGWTPLHRCAHVAHYKNAPHMEIFEYLLISGADPALKTYAADGKPASSVLDLVVQKGEGWEEGAVRKQLAALVEKHQHVEKKSEHTYIGLSIGPEAEKVLRTWEALPKLYPPKNWRPPPPAGYTQARGMRRHSIEPWRPAGEDDGSCMLRPMTALELEAQARCC